MAEAADQEEGALTTGWCQSIANGAKGADESYIQVINIDRNSPIVKLVVHDGRDGIQVCVATQAKAAALALKQGAILQADQDHYYISTMGGKRVAMFKVLNIIQDECEILDPCNASAPAPYYGANKLNQDAPVGSSNAPTPSPLFGNNRRKPAKSSPFMHNVVPKKIEGASGSRGFTPIANLNPFMPGFKIKGRVTEKGEMRSWDNAKGKGTLFSFTMLDESGEIKVTAFKEDAQKWFNEILEGEVYTLYKGRVKNDSYSKKYAITVTRETAIEHQHGERDSFAKKEYDFKSFSEIMNMDVPMSGPKLKVDTMCVAKSVGERQEFTARNDKKYTKREILCVDMSGIEMAVTMWGSNADEFTAESCVPGTILILPQASVSTFGGRSLSAQKVLKNVEDYEQAVALNNWWTTGGSATEFTSASSNTPIRRRDHSTFLEARRQNKGMKPQGVTDGEQSNFKGDWITVNGTVWSIRCNQERPPWYLSEPEGKKKVEQVGDKYQNKEGNTFDSYNCRWLLNFKFADYTQAEWCTSFDDVGNQMMQMSAKDMEKMFGDNFEEAEKYFQSRQFSEWTANILIKEDSWNDQPRMRYSVNNIKELNYVEDSKRMLEELRTSN